MINWVKGSPKAIEVGMLIHYDSGSVELVGSQRFIASGSIKAWYQAVPVYWLDWAEGLANKKELSL